ncbi:MAG: DUF1501 domain-containing protein [Burkholderiales bacterium]|nr:DUF1501 domain-containing protein [Burkholderiales bacterium]
MKPLTSSVDLARRALLRRGAALGALGAAAPMALNLSLLADAAAATAPADYKALVCVFLYGGNDHGNTLVPVDNTHHAMYASIRGSIATPQSALAATTLTPGTALPDGLQFALAPQLAPLKTLWDAGKLAVQLNVGPLIVPTTLAQYNAKSVPLPDKLMSHNDQQSTWQSDLAEGATSGWGGRMGDLMLSGNSGSVFTCTSVTGNAVFLSGNTAVQYQLSSSGAVAIKGIGSRLFGSSTAQATLRTLITGTSSHLFADEYARITRRSIDAEAQVTSALSAAPALATTFPATTLGNQLKMVARMLSARASFGLTRQVFFVSLGGFDLHDYLPEKHPGLLTEVADAMKAFYDATVELGLAQQVTSFTASDFGRTLSSNGDGSDHGWGSHHFVAGGAVKGKAFYGTAPAVAVSGPDDVGQGRLLPTTAVDQFGATLASWFGVTDTDLASVVPGIANFSQRNLGFLAA